MVSTPYVNNYAVRAKKLPHSAVAVDLVAAVPRSGTRVFAVALKPRPPSINRNKPQQPEIAQHLPGSQYDRRQRIIRNRNRQTSLLAYALIQILDQCSATGQHNPAITNIGGKFRRRPFQRHANRVQDRRNALRKRSANFFVINRNRY